MAPPSTSKLMENTIQVAIGRSSGDDAGKENATSPIAYRSSTSVNTSRAVSQFTTKIRNQMRHIAQLHLISLILLARGEEGPKHYTEFK